MQGPNENNSVLDRDRTLLCSVVKSSREPEFDLKSENFTRNVTPPLILSGESRTEGAGET